MPQKSLYSVVIGLIFVFVSDSALAHAEHDKARYVANSGVDIGRCDQPSSPCKTINYAAQHANKGDKIRLSSGSYPINDADTLFYLLSDLIPILANYQLKDGFQSRDASNLTYLTSVPMEYQQALTAKGFTVIADNKTSKLSATSNGQQIAAKLDVYARLQQAQINTSCDNNLAGDHPCKNIDLLAHLPLSSFSSNPSQANDIWGHYDLNDHKEYALIGLSNGIGVVDITEPTSPTVITTISSTETIWRDIKVYQYFDVNINQWQSYAYVTADNASVGLLVLDLSQLPNTVSVVATDKTDLSAHNIYLSNVDYSTGVALTGMQPYLHIVGSNNNGGGYNTYSLEDPRNLTSVYKPATGRNQYSHDVSSMVIEDERKDSQCVNGNDHCEIMFDFNENNFQLWDKTLNNSPVNLSATTYENASYVHSGWYSEDKLLMLVHDELDEQDHGLNTTLRLFELSNLTAPTLLSTWTGPTRAIDHNGYVRGNRYYMSNYERGLTVLDISDPTTPNEVGFFDTYPISNNASFNGAWGVYPFLPSGNIIASDINSGLYILKDNTLNVAQGSLSFDASNYQVNEGDSITVDVIRNDQAADNISVNWQLVTGSANSNDFTLASGTLNWADKDASVQSITIDTILDDLAEPAEVLFIRLFDPKNGATLSQPNLATITIAASDGAQIPIVNAGNNLNVNAGDTVNLSASASDEDSETLIYLWQQTSGPAVNINNSNQLNANFTAPEANTSLTFSFTAIDTSGLSASDSITVQVAFEVIIITPEPSNSRGGSWYYCLVLLFAVIWQRKCLNCL